MLKFRHFRFFSSRCLGCLAALLALESAVSARPQADIRRFVETVLTNFSAWDVNGNGRLDAKELTRALQDPAVKGKAAAAVAALKTSVDSDKKSLLPPLTRDYFQSADVTLEKLASAFSASEERLQAAAGKPIFTLAGPTLAGCKQAHHGDCYLIAATGTIIYRDPKRISQMFEPGPGDSQYRVQFPDGMRVTVPALTEGELALPGTPTENGLWLRMLEKAWGVRKMLRIAGKVDPAIEPSDVIDGPIPHDVTIEAMTGHRAKRYDLAGSKGTITPVAELRSVIRDGISHHHPMTADVVDSSVPGIVRHHAYAVLDYDAKSDVIYLWNPLVINFTPSGPEGQTHGYKTINGRFQMPLDDFQTIFEDVKIESATPKKATEKSYIH